MRLKLLKLLGYKLFTIGVTAHSWDGEKPPAFGYYPHLILRKGSSIKKVNFSKLTTSSQEQAENYARELGHLL